ncbi:hypothetical protein [Flavivirga eckloniae]|uniref:Host attachment protein n=1 Tax=Flavivirga eckloniae TaxID=1803846 RepID=A0A2K9PW94_9FLAO|nr:hypothetical protein [Flavivirga eckloniae]AUP81336.1 hypothetical protein C1H87_22485 [Flavivirga eckloniae]
MKKSGVWLDKEKAHIVTINGEEETFVTIKSDVDTHHVTGGSGTRFKGGPQDVVHDSKYMEREKFQLRTYFKNIIPHIKESGKIAIFGPAETFQKFKKELQLNYTGIDKKVIEVERADSMTDNQVKALVRDFFK